MSLSTECAAAFLSLRYPSLLMVCCRSATADLQADLQTICRSFAGCLQNVCRTSIGTICNKSANLRTLCKIFFISRCNRFVNKFRKPNVTSHGKTYTNVLTFNGLKHQLAVSHRQSAVSNPLVNVRRFHQTVRRFCQTVRRIHQTVRRIQQTVSSMEKALVVTL